jgi:hypothetical protein
VHTNHYLNPDLQTLEFGGLDLQNSQWRQERLDANFTRLAEPITMANCWTQLSDNTRGAGAVCNEDTEGRHAGFCTVATVVMNPAERLLWICAGGARTGERTEFRI